jgi:hypothetical protein
MFPATDVLIQLTFHTADTQWGHICCAGHLAYNKFAKKYKFVSRFSDLTKDATLYEQTCILSHHHVENTKRKENVSSRDSSAGSDYATVRQSNRGSIPAVGSHRPTHAPTQWILALQKSVQE